MCANHRPLTDMTVKNGHPLPQTDDLLDELHGAQYLVLRLMTCWMSCMVLSTDDLLDEMHGISTTSSLDLQQAYHQLRLHSEVGEKSPFNTHLNA